MQNLASPALVPTSQSAGGAAYGSAHAMTAPGSQPVDAMPADNERLPLPELPGCPPGRHRPGPVHHRPPGRGQLIRGRAG